MLFQEPVKFNGSDSIEQRKYFSKGSKPKASCVQNCSHLKIIPFYIEIIE